MKTEEELKQEYDQYVADIDPAMEKLANTLDGYNVLTGYTALVNLAALALFDAKGSTRRMMGDMMRNVLKKEAEDAAA